MESKTDDALKVKFFVMGRKFTIDTPSNIRVNNR